LGTGIARLRDSDIPTAGAVWAIVEREWNTGGTKDSESRSAEEPRLVWTSSREVPRSRDSCGRVAEHKVGPRISGTRGLGG
jgi:hypothetical protein